MPRPVLRFAFELAAHIQVVHRAVAIAHESPPRDSAADWRIESFMDAALTNRRARRPYDEDAFDGYADRGGLAMPTLLEP